MKIKLLFYRLKLQFIKNYKKFILIFKICLSLNKYFNLFNFLFIIWIKPLDLDFFNGLIEEGDNASTTKDDYKWWLEKILFVAMAVVTIYVLYKVVSNGSDIGGINSNVKVEPIIVPEPEEPEFISILDDRFLTQLPAPEPAPVPAPEPEPEVSWAKLTVHEHTLSP